MGCNSHLSIDVRGNWHDGSWDCFAENVREERWYALYAAMAGVRNYTDAVPVAQPRGLPEDVSDESRDFHHDHSDHNLTWLSPDEFSKAVALASKDTIQGPGKIWSAVERTLKTLSEIYGPDNVRLIVGFDN